MPLDNLLPDNLDEWTTEQFVLDGIHKLDLTFPQVARAARVPYHRLYRALRGGYGVHHLTRDELGRVNELLCSKLWTDIKTGLFRRPEPDRAEVAGDPAA